MRPKKKKALSWGFTGSQGDEEASFGTLGVSGMTSP